MSNKQAIYNYDKLGRLTNVTFSDGSMATYSYDTAGNRTTVVEVASITPPPPPTPMASGFAKRIAGDFKNNPMHVMLSGGEIMGWGDNATAVLANGVQAATDSLPQLLVFDSRSPVPPVTANIVDWVFTNANIYVVYSNGWVYSAGSNDFGQLGHGDVVDRAYLKRIEYFVTNGISITNVWAAGGYTTTNGGGCVYFQANDYTMYGCGHNVAGNLGNAATPTANVSTPAPCAGINHSGVSHVVDVAAAFVGTNCSAYMVLNDGSLMVAGYNAQGQLGLNSVTSQSGSFVAATSTAGTIANAKTISANAGSTTAGNALMVDTNGKVWTVGYNGHGELGIGSTTNQKVFTQVTALNAFNILKAELGGGLYGSGYALDDLNRLYTWGYNGLNNLFKGNTTTPQSTAAQVAAANLPSGIIAKVFFSKGNQGLATTPQMIVLTTAGVIAYAGADAGQLGIPDASGAFDRLLMPQDLLNGYDKVTDIFVHGTGLVQRWFLLTDKGNLYGTGNNADAICTGGYATAVAVVNSVFQRVNLG